MLEELMRISLNNSPWRLYTVSADHIAGWCQIISAPGIHIAGENRGIFQVAIHDSYVPWLHESNFRFKLDHKSLSPREIFSQGEDAATKNAVLRFLKDAMMAISSQERSGLDNYNRRASFSFRVLIEWGILKHDMVGIPHSLIKCWYLTFI